MNKLSTFNFVIVCENCFFTTFSSYSIKVFLLIESLFGSHVHNCYM